ncbi:hypothetical protein Pelo_6213 [Pelomyxa schiedti]|nr:hypothetical protein Pelo_6213 [Pelomyxa schiedti]
MAATTGHKILIATEKPFAKGVTKLPPNCSHAPQLKIVVRAGAGVDTIDLKACTARGIVVMNTPGQNSNAVVEMCFGQMITVASGWWQGKPGRD